MASWSSARPDAEIGLALIAAVMTILTPRVSVAQTVSTGDRDALVRLNVDRGGRAEDMDAVIRRADEAAAKGLPVVPLTNKIREGLAKGYDPKRIDVVIQQMVIQLEAADRLMRELEPAAAAAEREAAVTLLAESLASGVTADDVRELGRVAAEAGGASGRSGGSVSSERLSGAAKGLSFIKEAKLPAAEGAAVMVEAVRRGFASHELLDLGRAIKLRQNDYRQGRASLRALRDAIARGERPDQLFRDGRTENATRPAARPEAPAERPERPTRPATPQRPPPVERPAAPDRPGRTS